MGCDIHCHIEVMFADEWVYYGPGHMNRNYDAFAKMADVRNYYSIIDPISQPKGLPEDVTYMTWLHSEHYGSDGHSHSWLRSSELAELFTFLDEQGYPQWTGIGTGGRYPHTEFHVWLFGNSIRYYVVNGWSEGYPESLEDVRLVFWFDN